MILMVHFRPHYAVFPEDANGFALDDQFFVGGSGLLVKPVTEKGVTEASVYLPAEEQVSNQLPRRRIGDTNLRYSAIL